MTAKMMFILKNIYMISVPISMIFTMIAMLLPCWWSSETFQVGLWRARSFSSSWINIEPDTDTQTGRLLSILQILSFISIILTNMNIFIWLFILLHRHYHHSFLAHLLFLLFTIVTYFCLSLLLFFVWHSTTTHNNSMYLSYSFYLTIIILVFHTISLISNTINLAQYRTNHHTIQPHQIDEKIFFAFTEPIV